MEPHEDRQSFDLSRYLIHPNVLFLGTSHGAQCLFLESASFSERQPSLEDPAAAMSEANPPGEPSDSSRESQSEDQRASSLRQAASPTYQERDGQPCSHPLDLNPSEEDILPFSLREEEGDAAEGFGDQGDKWDLPSSPEDFTHQWKRPRKQVGGINEQHTHGFKLMWS